MTYSPIDTSCEAIKHQSTITRFGNSVDKKGMGITPDPFGAGAYNILLISALLPKGLVNKTKPHMKLFSLKNVYAELILNALLTSSIEC